MKMSVFNFIIRKIQIQQFLKFITFFGTHAFKAFLLFFFSFFALIFKIRINFRLLIHRVDVSVEAFPFNIKEINFWLELAGLILSVLVRR